MPDVTALRAMHRPATPRPAMHPPVMHRHAMLRHSCRHPNFRRIAHIGQSAFFHGTRINPSPSSPVQPACCRWHAMRLPPSGPMPRAPGTETTLHFPKKLFHAKTYRCSPAAPPAYRAESSSSFFSLRNTTKAPLPPSFLGAGENSATIFLPDSRNQEVTAP